MGKRPDPGAIPDIASGEYRPLTDVTHLGLVGDLRPILQRRKDGAQSDLRAGRYRLEFTEPYADLTLRDTKSREIIYRLHVEESGADTKLLISEGPDILIRDPLDEVTAQWLRECLAVAHPVEKTALELMEESELREEIADRAGDFLGGKNHAVVQAASRRYLHLFKGDNGSSRIFMEYVHQGRDFVESEEVLAARDWAWGSLRMVPEEDLDPAVVDQRDVREEVDREQAADVAGHEMGFTGRELHRADLERLFTDLASAKLVGRSTI